MGKAKSANSTAKQPLHEIKNGSVKKNKNPKFKNTSMSTTALIDNAKEQNKNVPPQKNFQKNLNSKNDNLSKRKIKQSKKNNESPKGKKNSQNVLQNKHVNKKNILEAKKELVEMDDSDSDIDEEITPQECSMQSIDETFEDEQSDTDVPNILGANLAEDSDEDDEDFEDEEEEKNEDDEEDNDSEEEEDEEEENIEHKGVKMFKGTKSKAKNKNLEVDEDEDDDEDDDDDDEEDESSDNDEDDINETDEEIESSQINTSASGIEEEDDEEEDDENDEDDEDDVENEGTLGLEALLGKSIADDDDDEDFDEDDENDEDDDISDEDEDDDEDKDNDNMVKVSKEKKAKVSNNEASSVNEQTEKKLSVEEQEEIDKRTICIDNVPKETKEKNIKKVFGQYGPINNIRFRGIIPQNPKMSKKVAAITGQIHPKATTVVVYVNYKSEESAKKALSMAGKLFEGNYVNVKIVAKSEQKRDHKKAVFIGNLKFGISPNIIWERFGECGEIESVHIMRDHKTGLIKGYGYVNFKSKDSVALALKLDGTEIYNRPIRVSPCLNTGNEKTSNKKGKKRHFSGEDNNAAKKFKNSQKMKTPAQQEANVKAQQKSQKGNEKAGSKNSASFQGQTADLKEKKKGNRFNKKKIMAEKLKQKKAAKA